MCIRKRGSLEERHKLSVCLCVHLPSGDLGQTRRSALEPRVVIYLSDILSPPVYSCHSFLTFPFLSPFFMTHKSCIYIYLGINNFIHLYVYISVCGWTAWACLNDKWFIRSGPLVSFHLNLTKRIYEL